MSDIVKNMSRKNRKIINFGTIGNILIFVSLCLLFLIFYPIVKWELSYRVKESQDITYQIVANKEELKDVKEDKKVKILVPPNTNFSIVIPKIEAVAPVISEVDYRDPEKFLPELKKGVAHAMGTPYPNESGNVYIFAHSTDAFYNVNYYNAVFYLLGKLEKGDEIVLFYKDKKYIYSVSEVKVVSKDDTYYLGKLSEGKTLTLQTCYPPGTTLKRLVVISTLVD